MPLLPAEKLHESMVRMTRLAAEAEARHRRRARLVRFLRSMRAAVSLEAKAAWQAHAAGLWQHVRTSLFSIEDKPKPNPRTFFRKKVRIAARGSAKQSTRIAALFRREPAPTHVEAEARMKAPPVAPLRREPPPVPVPAKAEENILLATLFRREPAPVEAGPKVKAPLAAPLRREPAKAPVAAKTEQNILLATLFQRESAPDSVKSRAKRKAGLAGLLRPVKPALAGEARSKQIPAFFRNKRLAVPFTGQVSASKRDRRSDLVVAALGITLGLICALFPWYIFFNPEQFGIRAMKFAGNGGIGETGTITLGPQPERVGAASVAEEIPPMKLDLFATGTTPREGDDQDKGTPGLTEQPFPEPLVPFKLVHVANGRAMIEDDRGLFIVQRGSVLPDSSRVASIEEREGHWVLVTSTEQILEIAE